MLGKYLDNYINSNISVHLSVKYYVLSFACGFTRTYISLKPLQWYSCEIVTGRLSIINIFSPIYKQCDALNCACVTTSQNLHIV